MSTTHQARPSVPAAPAVPGTPGVTAVIVDVSRVRSRSTPSALPARVNPYVLESFWRTVGSYLRSPDRIATSAESQGRRSEWIAFCLAAAHVADPAGPLLDVLRQ